MQLKNTTTKEIYTLFWRHLRCYNSNMGKTYMNDRGHYLQEASNHMKSAHVYSTALQKRITTTSKNKHLLVSSHIHGVGRIDRYNRRFWVYKRLGVDRASKVLERWDAITDGHGEHI